MAKTSSSSLFGQNFAINGLLDFWQRIEGTTITVNTATTVSAYGADRINYVSVGATVKNYSIVRSSDVPTLTQAGVQLPWSQLYTVITPIASFAAGDRVAMWQYFVEGFDYANLHAKTTTFQFWVKASATGTYSFALRNGANNRCYVTTYSVSVANTWEFKTITVPLDSSGTWAFDNGVGLAVNVGDYGGSSSQTSTLNAWQAGAFTVANTATNYYAAANTIRIAGFGIYKGSTSQRLSRSGGTFGGELLRCQRYCQTFGRSPDQTNNTIASGFAASATSSIHHLKFHTTMRANPVLIVTPGDWAVQRNGGGTAAVTAFAFNNVGISSARVGANVAAGLTAGEGLILISGNQNGIVVDAEL